MGKGLSKLQQDILTAARENGGVLTYKKAYVRFIGYERPRWVDHSCYGPRHTPCYLCTISKRNWARRKRFPKLANALLHTMNRLVHRGLATNYFSKARILRMYARELESGYRRAIKPEGISVLSPGGGMLKK
jgi:hypothetical protein